MYSHKQFAYPSDNGTLPLVISTVSSMACQSQENGTYEYSLLSHKLLLLINVVLVEHILHGLCTSIV